MARSAGDSVGETREFTIVRWNISITAVLNPSEKSRRNGAWIRERQALDCSKKRTMALVIQLVTRC